MTVSCRKRLIFAETGYGVLFASLASFGGVADGAAISCRSHSVLLSEVAHEVRVRAKSNVLQHLFHGEKRGP